MNIQLTFQKGDKTKTFIALNNDTLKLAQTVQYASELGWTKVTYEPTEQEPTATYEQICDRLEGN